MTQTAGHELGPTVGMIGAGQLAQMSVAPATALGVRFRVLANNAEEPAALVCANTVLGFKDETVLWQTFDQMFKWAMDQPERNVKNAEYELENKMYSFWKK